MKHWYSPSKFPPLRHRELSENYFLFHSTMICKKEKQSIKNEWIANVGNGEVASEDWFNFLIFFHWIDSLVQLSHMWVTNDASKGVREWMKWNLPRHHRWVMNKQHLSSRDFPQASRVLTALFLPAGFRLARTHSHCHCSCVCDFPSTQSSNEWDSRELPSHLNFLVSVFFAFN